ncbi:MAG: hypothetical protein LC808_31965, partial [Actinobacteria bacterium]|nr:hypothetical protein [Actinomycetota bacterium]
MPTLDELWSRLREVRTLRYAASSEAETGWTGVGSGSVVVSMPADGELVFEESGTWRPERGGPT